MEVTTATARADGMSEGNVRETMKQKEMVEVLLSFHIHTQRFITVQRSFICQDKEVIHKISH